MFENVDVTCWITKGHRERQFQTIGPAVEKD